MFAMNHRIRFAGASALLIAMAVVIGQTDPVVGQQRVGDDGRALDANQQAGSNGVNPEREQLDFRLRNDIVTGNAGGGRSFRDDVGYQAPGEFRDTTGADDLFPFRRDAATGVPGGGVRGATDPGSVYRPYTSPHAARPRLGQQQGQTPWSIDGQRALRSDVDLRIRPGRQFDSFDRIMLEGEEGDWLDVSASPLLGVRSDLRAGRGRADSLERFDLWRDSPLLPDQDDPLQMREEDWEIDRSLRRSSLLDTRAYQLSSGEATLDEQGYRSPMLSPTLMLGNQLRSQVLDPDRDPRQADGDEQRLAQLEEQMFRPLQSVRSVEPGEDVYLDLLAAMRDPDDASWENRRNGQQDDADEQRTDDADENDPFAMPDALRDDADERDQERDAEDGRDGVHERDRTRAEALLERLDHDLPPLDTLAGEGEGQTNQRMRKAEELLRNGRFFDAEALYREIVVRDVEAPMARVGLTHAQLSAGMIRSAAMNLRALFEQHPELIATRYDADLLPPADRLNWIVGELRRMMNDERHAPKEAALLLAYLGYQQDDEAMIHEGLDAVERRDEHDGLLHVLRPIWLDESEDESEPEDE